MRVIDHLQQPSEPWRPGVVTTMLVSATVGSAQLCIFDQLCEPGLGAPAHLHAVEEVLTIIAGEAEVWAGGARQRLTAGQSVIIPAGRLHGFRNTGTSVLHVRATLAAPIFEASYEDKTETPRRYVPER
jgi:quercetin dioxygenase-like cupin family protein